MSVSKLADTSPITTSTSFTTARQLPYLMICLVYIHFTVRRIVAMFRMESAHGMQLALKDMVNFVSSRLVRHLGPITVLIAFSDNRKYRKTIRTCGVSG
eukprot:scaffold3079_cov187-Ochromonas_danica.AAC.6